MSTPCASSLSLRQGGTLVFAFISVTLLFDLPQSKMAAVCADTPKREITCRAGTFLPGQNASVSCNFPTDVAADGDDIIVSRLPVNASKDAIWFDTLVCGWKGIRRPYECDVTKGFRFDGVISDHLKLNIPDVGIDKAGMYICFIVSSDRDIPSAECELTVNEIHLPSPETKNGNSTSNSSNEKGEGTDVALISISIVLFIVLIASQLVFVRCFLAGRKNTPRQSIHRRDNNNNNDSVTHPLVSEQLPNKRVLDLLRRVELTPLHCEQVMKSLHEEIGEYKRNRLPFIDDDDANNKMYSVPMTCPPIKTEGGGFTVVEISNTIIRIHNVGLQKPQFETTYTCYPIPKEIIHGTGIQLLDFIADCAQKFYKRKFHTKKLYLGFVFSCPFEYKGDLTQARFTTMNSVFRLDDLVDTDVQELLCEAFRRKHKKSRLKVTVILSNAAGTLMSVAKKDQHSWIGVSLVDGFHACYLQEGSNNKSNLAEDNMMVFNIVLGAFGKSGCLQNFITDYDKDLDLHSIHPGKQILEKMVSVAYIGETVRLVLTTLAEKGLLFSSGQSRYLLNKKDSFTAEYVKLIESEIGELGMFTDHVLTQLKIEQYTTGDSRTVRYVVHAVLKRAAHLAATFLAVLVNQTDTPKVTIAVDGNLSHQHPIFFGILRDTTRKLVKPEKEVEFKDQINGSVIGAALAANLLKSSHAADNLPPE